MKTKHKSTGKIRRRKIEEKKKINLLATRTNACIEREQEKNRNAENEKENGPPALQAINNNRNEHYSVQRTSELGSNRVMLKAFQAEC